MNVYNAEQVRQYSESPESTLTLAIVEEALIHNILGVYYLVISMPNKLFGADLLFTIPLATPTRGQSTAN